MSRFSWSYTKLRDFEQCPRQFEWKHVAKNKEPETQELKWGKYVHKALEDYAISNIALPIDLALLQPIANAIDKVWEAGYQVLGEQQWAITEGFQPCGWKDWDIAWNRSVVDFGFVHGRRATLFDYKTGKKRDDDTQLALFAAVGFIHLPQVDVIDTQFLWVRGDKSQPVRHWRSTQDIFWQQMLPRVERMRKAIEIKQFPAKPSGLCREWCPVMTCEHNGKNQTHGDARG